ncbi:MAG: helix-turn-helix transcriptional regulator [Croceibacterium sp.]
MTDIWCVTDWRLPPTIGPAYEALIGAIGSEDFGGAVRDGIDSLTSGTRRLYLFEAASGQDALHYFHCEQRIADLLPDYSLHYKQLDPIADLYRAAPRTGDVAVQRVRPADIGSTGFRRRFFEEPGIVERISVVLRGKDGWTGLNVARHASHGRLSERELEAVTAIARLALPMLALARPLPAHGPALTPAQLAHRFAGRWPALTSREREVCACAACGLSVAATASRLGIAKTSVVTFRQRAYRRLGISNAIELLPLVTN